MKKLETILLIDDSNSSNQYNRVLLKEMGIAGVSTFDVTNLYSPKL
jgi:hypothetical protein